jgi:hypothetical protein
MATVSVNRAAILSWGFLVCASIATGLLIEGEGLDARSAVSLILLIAVVKVRMIVLHYMELKHAPLRWRLVFELWPVVAASLILGIWFFTGAAADCPTAP